VHEWAGYGMAALIAFGIPATQAYGRHAEIDFISARLSPRVRRIHAVICNLAGVFAGLTLAVGAASFGLMNFNLGIRSTGSLAVPLWIPQILLVAGGLAFAFEFTLDLLNLRPRLRRTFSAGSAAAVEGTAD
jgi:TRAP-type C4-dicarboxylate transport system permease small subunit